MISVPVATAVSLGAIIGAGIFTLSGTAIALAGTYALLAFVLVGVIGVIIAYEASELSSMMRSAKGAAYSFVYSAFGSEMGFVTGSLYYFSSATSIAVMSLGFGAYAATLFGVPQAYAIAISLLLIAVLSLVNLRGIAKTARTDFWLVAAKLCILLFFIGFALYVAGGMSGSGFLSNFTSLPSQSGILPIFQASVAIFFAYSGFQVVSTFASRVKGGAKGVAKAIIASVLISTIVYVFVVIALISLVPASQYQINADPLAFALAKISAPAYVSIIVDIGALVATTSAALANILVSSRIAYQMSKDGLLPGLLRKYSPEKDVAPNGVLLTAFIAGVTLFAGNVYVVASISNFGLLFSYLFIGFAIIHFRRIKKAAAQIVTPLYPYLTIVGIAGIFLFMAGMPNEALLIGVTLVLLLLAAYYTLREFRFKKIVRVRLFN